MSDEQLPTSKLTTSQIIKEGKNITFDGESCRMVVTIRHDDHCGNGHNTFSITGKIATKTNPRNPIVVGCIHHEVSEHWPEYSHLIKWHLTSTDGPLHYLANTTYLASNRDHNGRAKGEPSQWNLRATIGNSPVTHEVGKGFAVWAEQWQTDNFTHGVYIGPGDEPALTLVEVHHPTDSATYSPHYAIAEYQPDPKWHEANYRTASQAREWTAALLDPSIGVQVERVAVAWSEGKERDLAAARRAAVWPDATVEQLTDTQALTDRLPALLASFKADVEELGMEY